MNDFQLNDVVVRPRLNEIHIDGRDEKLPAKFIDVLMALAERPGELCGKSELLKRVWNDPAIGEDSLANAVWMLRKTLKDDARRPVYIETVPRRGYRLLAQVGAVKPQPCPETGAARSVDAAIHDAPAPPVAMEELRSSSHVPALTRHPRVAPRQRRSIPSRRAGLLTLLVLVAAAGIAFGWSTHRGANSTSAAAVFAFRTGGDVAGITVPERGIALVADNNGLLSAIDTVQGTERWRFTAGGAVTAPVSIADARVYLGGDDGYVYALDATNGRERWRYAAGQPVDSVPLASGGCVIFGDTRGGVQALRSVDGAPLWNVQLGKRVIGTIPGPLDLAVVRLLDGSVVAIDRTSGRVRWERHFAGPLSNLVLASDTQLLFASDMGYLLAVDARDGATLWQTELPAAELQPLVVGNRVFGLGRHGDLTALGRDDGHALWRTHLAIGDLHDLLWWRDRIVVVLDSGVLALVDPADGQVERRLRLPEIPNGLASDAQRLIVTGQSGRVVAIDRAMLDGLADGDLALAADGVLRVANPGDAVPSEPAIEALRAGAGLPALRWRVPVVGHVHDVSIDTNGMIYFADDVSATALAPDVQIRWRESLSPASGTEFAIAATRVYFGRRDRYVYALDRLTGRQIWRFATGAQVISPPTLVGDRIYVGSDDRHLYALRADSGAVLWSYETGRPVRGAVVAGPDSVVFGSADHQVYALDSRTGTLRWRFKADDWVVAHPLLVGQRVFVGSGNGDFHALDLDSGKPLWRFHSGAKVWYRAAADSQNIYFGSGDGCIYALDQSTGIERWRYRTGAAAEGSVLLGDGVLYAGSHDSHLYALDTRDGQPQWRLRTGGSVYNPASDGGMLYVASADQHLYALKLRD